MSISTAPRPWRPRRPWGREGPIGPEFLERFLGRTLTAVERPCKWLDRGVCRGRAGMAPLAPQCPVCDSFPRGGAMAPEGRTHEEPERARPAGCPGGPPLRSSPDAP